ncbi:MAG: energy transducer TonB, partial [Oxalobacter sp.]|nr:energy transducer TonB [Oxalobacter sp.]
STLYISVLQAPDRQGKAVPASREKTQPASIEKQAVPHGRKKENTLIATDSVSDRTARAEATLLKDTVRENEPVIKENASTKETRSSASSAIDESRSPETGGGSGHDTKTGPGNGGGNGTGDGAITGDGSGPGSNMARSVPLSRLNYKHAFKPEYPERSIQRNEAGQVSVRVVVGTDGRVHDARIVSSSGFDRLDHAALKAARRSTFHPYSENGRVLAAMAVIPYQFNLKNQ